MTPAQGWHPADYYRASRAARAAWQARDQQLTLLPGGLEGGGVARAEGMPATGCGATSLEPAPTPPSPPRPGGLAPLVFRLLHGGLRVW